MYGCISFEQHHVTCTRDGNGLHDILEKRACCRAAYTHKSSDFS